MHATSSSTLGALPRRRTGLIAVAVLALATLAAAAALLDPGEEARVATPAAAAAMVPVGIVGDSAVSGDPSVPSAASVFKDRNSLPEEPVVGF